MKVIGIIPARFQSTRFPGKPLQDILGKTMIQRVYEQACKSKLLSNVVVATDDNRIYDHIKSFGGNVEMTSPNHKSGTDRCNEVISILEAKNQNYDIAINIQGDEPYIEPEQIDALISCFNDTKTQVATLIKQIVNNDDLFNSNCVKVVKDTSNFALYFSRSPIPYIRNAHKDNWIAENNFYKHIGIYGYRTEALKDITKLNVSSLENAESLEQLRWLENGYSVKTAITKFESIAVDTPEDLQRIIQTKS